MPLTCNRSKEIQLQPVTDSVWTLGRVRLESDLFVPEPREVRVSPRSPPQYLAIIHVWRDLMTVSTAPPPACLTLY